MLDDLKYIHEKDAQDALGVAEKQAEQLRYEFTMSVMMFQVNNIVYAGMGGSALGALVSQTWPGYTIPFTIVRDYKIPEYVNGNTLFIATSYSGNTEETVEALQEAGQRGAHCVVIASGGTLEEIANQKSYPFVKIPFGIQPRHALLYMFKALMTVLENTANLHVQDAGNQMKQVADFIDEAIKAWRPDVPTAQNPAKLLAQELMGKSPVIYAGPTLWPAAYKWKINFNENAKNVAWCNQFSEFNHNEFIGWSGHPIDKPYGIIELRSNLEHSRIQKRFEVSDKLLSGQWPNPHIVQAQGETILEQLLWCIALGDFVSLYLALLNGINPTPVDLIEKLKAELQS